MSARSKARKRALDLLFEAESRGLNLGSLLEQRIESPVTEHPLPEYTRVLVAGVVDHWTDIDEALTTYSQGWSLERMPDVDRAILRVGVWELLFNDDGTPTARTQSIWAHTPMARFGKAEELVGVGHLVPFGAQLRRTGRIGPQGCACF